MYYEIFSCVIGSIYLVIGALLLARRNNPHIAKRSPWLVHITHWSNLAEILLILPTATSTVIDESTPTIKWQLFDCGILICHFLIFFSYLLRSYRIHTILDLSNPNKFHKYLVRTTQKFLVKILCLMMFPVLMTSLFILSYDKIASYFPISQPGDSYTQQQIASCVYITSSFIEQICFVFIAFSLRHIDDKYNMIRELVVVAFLWYISPLFSNFINIDRNLWLITIVGRNLLLVIVSSLNPVIASYKKVQFEEPLTLDMLNSLNIILENLKCLKFFEKFLTKTCLGSDVLEFYQKCECEMINNESNEYKELNDYYIKGRLPKELISEEINSKSRVNKAKDEAFKYMEKMFYLEFLKSEECDDLKVVVRKEEIIVSRVRKTSLHRKVYLASNKIDPKNVDRTSRTVGRLL